MPKPRAAAALQRLQIALNQIDEEAERIARRREELDRRMTQLKADIEREERLIADNAGIMQRLSEEESELKTALEGSGERSAALKAAFEAAQAKLAESETSLGVVTAERAEAAAERTQLERLIREAGERKTRLDRQIASQDADLASIAERIAGLPDPTAKRRESETAEQALVEAERALAEIETALEAARETEAAARQPVTEAKARLNAIETEAKTIARMLNAGQGSDLFPPVVEQIKVDRGYETALGAALGDDLDLPLDPAAPAHWARMQVTGEDAPLPEGVTPLSTHVRAPEELARRLAHIGLIADADHGKALHGSLKPGQRLVTRDGAVFRWDGYVASADAPTPAALRLEQKNRLAELNEEAVEATRALRQVEEALAQSEAAVVARVNESRAARELIRDASRNVSRARDELASAERASGELSNRRAVLSESRAQVGAQLSETVEALAQAEQSLKSCPDLAGLDAALAQINAQVATDRGGLAEARAAHEGLERENAARARRLEAIASERANWLERAANAENHLAALAARSTEAAAEVAGIAEAPDEIAARRRQLMHQLTEAEKRRKEAGDRLALAETAAREADKAATDSITALSRRREERAGPRSA
jgi:chromosome segregation protein